MKFFVIVLFIGCALSCKSTSETQNVSLTDLQTQFEAIQEFVNQGTCNPSNKCSYIAYGTKACGGPQGYLAFSPNVNIDKLKNLVATYSKAEDMYNQQNGIMSDCISLTPPQNLGCSNGKCVILD